MKTEIKIDKGVAIPSGYKTKYPYHKMEVGDSFFVDKPIYSSVYAYGIRNNKKFTVRQEGTGYRVWRIE